MTGNGTSIDRECLRINVSYQGKRLLHYLESFTHNWILEQYPDIQYQNWATGDDELVEKWIRKNNFNLIDRFNFIVVYTDPERIRRGIDPSIKINNVKVLHNYEDIDETTIANLFHKPFFKHGMKFEISPVNVKSLRKACKQSTTLYSKNKDDQITALSMVQTHKGEQPDLIVSSVHMRAQDIELLNEHIHMTLWQLRKVSTGNKMNIRFTILFEDDITTTIAIIERYCYWKPSHKPREATVLMRGSLKNPKHKL